MHATPSLIGRLCTNNNNSSTGLLSHFISSCSNAELLTATAVTLHDQKWTYAELRTRIEHVAGALNLAGVEKGDVVAVRTERTVEAVAAIYALLSLGAIYLPLDERLPDNRARSMLTHADATWLISDRDVPEANCVKARFRLRDLHGPRLRLGSVTLHGCDLAYIIFTSGSTGQPKGVAITHGSVRNLIDWAVDRFRPAELSSVLASTCFSFDMSIFEIFVPLAAGGSIYLVSSILQLPDLPKDCGITLINTVPSALSVLLDFELPLRDVQVCLLGGEPLHSRLARHLYSLGVKSVYNLYGPTEDTVYSTEFLVPHDSEGPVPIGRPLPGHAVVIVDPSLAPVPAGVTGELCLLGIGLARGYVRQEALTADRFVELRCEGFAGRRMYRTGDSAVIDEYGRLIFLGRLDDQIKIRGHRVQLEEISAVVAAVEGVGQVKTITVDTSEGATKRQVHTYVALRRDLCEFHAVERRIAKQIAEHLPHYMKPDRIFYLDEIPVLPNGKPDVLRLQDRERLDISFHLRSSL